MEPVIRVAGHAMPLDRANVDTDQIIPASFLKRLGRTGYEDGLFAAWRKDPGFVLNDPRYSAAAILIAGPNFGCGSSREHAVWALHDAGFRAVIAPSFADIFRSNCLRNGLVPAAVDAGAARTLMAAVLADPGTEVVVDVEAGRLRARSCDVDTALDLDEFARSRLLKGLDDVALTLQAEAAIAAHEARRPEWLPRVPVGGRS